MTAQTMVLATRQHEICCGHRVVGHENKCRALHGHNYMFTLKCQAPALDEVGRVIDFSVIKSTLCEWLERNWDHKFLAWEEDEEMRLIVNAPIPGNAWALLRESIVWVPFNPTAENIGTHLLEEVAPFVLPSDVRLVWVEVRETGKCAAEVYA